MALGQSRNSSGLSLPWNSWKINLMMPRVMEGSPTAAKFHVNQMDSDLIHHLNNFWLENLCSLWAFWRSSCKVSCSICHRSEWISSSLSSLESSGIWLWLPRLSLDLIGSLLPFERNRMKATLDSRKALSIIMKNIIGWKKILELLWFGGYFSGLVLLFLFLF